MSPTEPPLSTFPEGSSFKACRLWSRPSFCEVGCLLPLQTGSQARAGPQRIWALGEPCLQEGLGLQWPLSSLQP